MTTFVNTCGFVLDVEDGRIVPVGGSVEIEGKLSDHDHLLVERGVLTKIAPSHVDDAPPAEPDPAVAQREQEEAAAAAAAEAEAAASEEDPAPSGRKGGKA